MRPIPCTTRDAIEGRDGKTSGDARGHEHDQADPEQLRPAEHVGEHPAAQQQKNPPKAIVARLTATGPSS